MHSLTQANSKLKYGYIEFWQLLGTREHEGYKAIV